MDKANATTTETIEQTIARTRIASMREDIAARTAIIAEIEADIAENAGAPEHMIQAARDDIAIERRHIAKSQAAIDGMKAACPMCTAYEQTGLGISDDEFAIAEAAGTICGQCAEVVAENREVLGV